MILDAENCRWLLRYPKQPIAGGSMYAFRLPAQIPAAGTPGGPPLPADTKTPFGGTKDFSFRDTTLPILRDPAKLGSTVQAMMAKYQRQQQEQAGKTRQK